MKKALVGISLLMSFTLFAQQQGTQNLDEVVIQGNRIEVPFSESARDIQIITQKEIQALPVKSLNEVLAYVNGVDIRQRGPFGTQADISIDGGSSEQTIVLINGVKMINSQTAHNMMNLSVPLNAIDHIEVLRGAAARIYGINTLTGVINIVTKKENHSFVVADVQAGSSFSEKDPGDGEGIYFGGDVQVTGNFDTEKQSHLLSVGQNYYNGQRYNTATKRTQLFYNGNYDFNSNNSIHAMAGYSNSRFGANGYYAAPGDKNSEELLETALFSLSTKHKWNNFILSPRISNRYDEDDYRYLKNNLNVGRSKHYTNALMAEINSSLKTGFGTFGFGLESRFGEINSSNIGKHKRNNHGAYAELRSHLGEKIKGTIGVYTNYNTDYGWQVYPGIDVAYFINSNWKLSASVGSGQRIPSFTDLYLNQTGNVGNPLLKPENAWSYQGDVSFNKDGFNIKAGYFYRSITNFIDWIRDSVTEPYSPINYGENKMHGIYGRISHTFRLGKHHLFGYNLSYNYLQPTVRLDGEINSKYVLSSLKHQFISGIHYSFKGFSIQVNNRWIQRELGDPYDVLDVQLNYEWEHFMVYTQVTNILDTDYIEAGAVPMPTRWFSIGLRYKFHEK